MKILHGGLSAICASALGSQALATAQTAGPPPETARDLVSQPYVRVSLGANRPFATEARIAVPDAASFPAPPPSEATIDFDAGLAAGVAIGADVWSDFTAELEFRHIRNRVDTFSFDNGIDPSTGEPPDTASPAAGSNTSNAVLANLLYNFGERGEFRPYVGAGAGVARVSQSAPGLPGQVVDGEEWTFALQGRLGFGVEVIDDVALGLDYSFFATGDVDAIAADGVRAESDGVRASIVSVFVSRRF